MDEPSEPELARHAAKRVLDVRVDDATQQRIDALADKCTEGTLSADEHAEYQHYVSLFNHLTLLQAKARTLLNSDS